MKSFPSGHSAHAIYAAFFIIILFYKRRSSKLLFTRRNMISLFVGLVYLSVAVFTCWSRWAYNHHHWWDIVVGALLGLAMALLCTRRIPTVVVEDGIEEEENLFFKPMKCFWNILICNIKFIISLCKEYYLFFVHFIIISCILKFIIESH